MVTADGNKYSADAAARLAKELPQWGALNEEMKVHIAAHDVPLTDLSLSPMLTFDVGTGKFTGEEAAKANTFLKRQYRDPYVVPEIS